MIVHERLEGQVFPTERLSERGTSATAQGQVNNLGSGHESQQRKIRNSHVTIIIEAGRDDDPLSAVSWAEKVAKVA